MIDNFNEKPKNRDYNSELLLKILNKIFIKTENSNEKELFVDENWKINSKKTKKTNSPENSNLKRILSEIFPDEKISINDNNDGSQTILVS